MVHRQRLKGWSNGKHRDQWINTLRDHAFPEIGDKLVSEISTADVLAVLTPIWLTKYETARRVRQRTRAVLEWAAVAGHREGANPAVSVGAGLPRQPDQGRHFEAMPYADVPAFIRKLRPVASGEIVRLSLEFLILTAARTNEVTGGCWAEIDMDEAAWTIPVGRMKARRQHRVPLSPRCLEILNACQIASTQRRADLPRTIRQAAVQHGDGDADAAARPQGDGTWFPVIVS